MNEDTKGAIDWLLIPDGLLALLVEVLARKIARGDTVPRKWQYWAANMQALHSGKTPYQLRAMPEDAIGDLIEVFNAVIEVRDISYE